MQIGKYNTLKIDRKKSVGLYLINEENGDDVLLPNKYCPEEYEIGDELEVFVYLDYDARKIATNLTPKIQLHQFALLEVVDTTSFGAFMDWGLEKHLLVPHKEQRNRMEIGRWYVVYMDIDEQTGRLYGSNRLDRFLKDEVWDLEEGDEVDIIITKQTELGLSVIVNNAYKGLVFYNDVYSDLKVGDVTKGYVKQIRDDEKLDISLQPIGFQRYKDANMNLIYEALLQGGGSLSLNDKSAPEVIYARFGISKKAFKRAIGNLYKERKILIDKNGIRLTEKTKKA